jgi:hypothetical protein
LEIISDGGGTGADEGGIVAKARFVSGLETNAAQGRLFLKADTISKRRQN